MNVDKKAVPAEQGWSTAEEKQAEMLKYLQENCRTVTLDELSEKFHYSRRHLQRIIQKETGSTLIENLQSWKISEAGKLLCETQLSISEIYTQLGFRSPNYFRRLFRDYYGVTPLQYRKERRK